MDIVTKIKALLAKAASTDNQHEAEIFLAKAHELMEKHQLESSDLENEDPIDVTVGPTANGGASPDWDFQLMFSVARYFGCKGIQWWSQNKTDGSFIRSGQYQMKIVGRESARITAIEMHKYLVATVRRLGRENCTKMGLSAPNASRRIGRSLQLRINDMIPSEPEATTAAGKNALITLDGVLAKFEELFPDSKLMGGSVRTTATARSLAEGIGLNLQTPAASTRLLK